MDNAIHFIGFRDDRVFNAIRVWGRPDFWHRRWDARAIAEIMPGDKVVFADPVGEPNPNAWDDSEEDIRARS